MTGRVRNYYAAGNTARGFYSFFDSVLEGLERLYILKGGPGTGKSTLMRKVGDAMSRRGFDIEIIHCASDNDSIDGVIVTDLKVGIVDGTAPHVIEPKAPGAIEEYVNLGVAWDSSQLRAHKEDIVRLNRDISACFQQAYEAFAAGLSVHDNELEQIYFDHLDIAKANELTKQLIADFFRDTERTKQATVKRRFLGAATPKGPVNFIPNLTEHIGKRYFIKGRPGCGKSHMMKKIAAEAEKRGIDAEVYHCGFDPHSLDMVLLPELDIAIFDSTDPHEHFPDRENDKTIDMYEQVITPGTDEKYAKEIHTSHKRYKAKMKEGTSCLAQAKVLHDELEAFYIRAMDFGKLEQIGREILDEIDTFAVS